MPTPPADPRPSSDTGVCSAATVQRKQPTPPVAVLGALEACPPTTQQNSNKTALSKTLKFGPPVAILGALEAALQQRLHRGLHKRSVALQRLQAAK